jgi:hypothetical protein
VGNGATATTGFAGGENSVETGGGANFCGGSYAGTGIAIDGNEIASVHGVLDAPGSVVHGSVSTTGTATTSFVVSMGVTLSGTTYAESITPTSTLAAAPYYITSKTTTTFTVHYVTAITGAVSFDWIVTQQ